MRLQLIGTVTVVSLAMAVAACGDDDGDSDSTTTTTTTTTTTASGGNGGGGNGGSGGAAAATGRARVAHLSPDAPAVDFCVDGGDGFIGPVLAGAGDADGLAYPEVTDYLELPAATYSVRLVAPGAADCDTPLGPPDTTGITLPEDVDATIAAIGMLTPGGTDQPFELSVYVDDNTPPSSGQIKVRFIHASPDTPGVDVGLGSEAGMDFMAVWDNVMYPNVGQVSGNDYLETPPLSDATLSAQANDSMMDALVLNGVNAPADAIVTAFAIGNLDADPQALQVLLCVDNAPTSTCTAVP